MLSVQSIIVSKITIDILLFWPKQKKKNRLKENIVESLDYKILAKTI